MSNLLLVTIAAVPLAKSAVMVTASHSYTWGNSDGEKAEGLESDL